ncbi:MAG TPA: hypothetical protein VHP33_36925 [Polyangiaceae bacterium]|nr:hypothetical protein [Polyangiaceae bacterium]
MQYKPWSAGLSCVLGVIALGCGDDASMTTKDETALGAPNPHGTPGDAQTPPTTNGADVEAWLKQGDYKSWTCETAQHSQLKVSPHGFNRVCSNELAAGFSGGVGDERPVNTASVKELYDDAAKLVGYAVGVKVQAKSADGDGWYWYERVPLDSAAPHDDNGVVADGLGSAGAANSICVGCHTGAGSDSMHKVTGSSDFVYLQAQAETVNPEGDAQTPPTNGADNLEAWLEKGDYKSWACETVEHSQMKVSPHGVNRVCSNELAAGFKGAVTDERPLGTASVKELYDDASALVGYAVGVKVGATSEAGANWYWYERIAESVPADGLGDAEPAKSVCVGCHAGAGSDAMHAVTGSSDFVYLQVAP